MNMQPQKIEPSFEDRLIRHYAARRLRLMSPANAVKDVVPSRPLVAVCDQVEDEPAEEPAPVRQKAPRPMKGRATRQKIEAIKRVYRRGITAGEIAELLGTTRNAILGIYNRNKGALRSCPLVATRGKTKR